MLKSIEHSLLIGLIPLGLVLLGGLAAIFFRLSKGVESTVLHFAAGVVFSVVAVELLPDVIRIHRPIQIISGFVVGVVLMLVIKSIIKKLAAKTERTEENNFPATLFVGVAIDIFIDGLLVGIAFSVGSKEGLLLTLAIGIELFSLGLATATAFRKKSITKLKTFTYIALPEYFSYCPMQLHFS
ncbi:hypothetical protein Belba_0275 [Belliella baltica DSM 15883]|uniref:Divalent heavy-metal cations transporter n=1 Tax=Belliella baltica (strain DSM 15883 / CIP 108006 / LMG 21964 / BA134) TaxID=866536 RepID=I3Z123_BELBD|nr:hypothetical protein [Belliella baltica]AFL82941.1 hypothetical protein Belba_0275 [Belliella baltica DSM 15883]